jgi:hypothetical protein
MRTQLMTKSSIGEVAFKPCGSTGTAGEQSTWAMCVPYQRGRHSFFLALGAR